MVAGSRELMQKWIGWPRGISIRMRANPRHFNFRYLRKVPYRKTQY